MIGILEQIKIAGAPPVGGLPTTDMIGFFSFRKLPSWSGNCVKVRRASDLSLLDVGFSSDYLNKPDISSFCDGTTGHGHTWFNQAGTGNPAINVSTTLAALPKIFASGAFYTVNGKEGFSFTSNEVLPLLTQLLAVKSVFAVVKINGLVTVNYLTFSGSPKVDGLYLGGTGGGINGFGVVENNAIKFSNTVENTNQNLQTYISGTDKKVWTNGANQATESAPFNDINIGAISRSGFSINGVIQELILYSSDQTANRLAIEANINEYYSIY